MSTLPSIVSTGGTRREGPVLKELQSTPFHGTRPITLYSPFKRTVKIYLHTFPTPWYEVREKGTGVLGSFYWNRDRVTTSIIVSWDCASPDFVGDRV